LSQIKTASQQQENGTPAFAGVTVLMVIERTKKHRHARFGLTAFAFSPFVFTFLLLVPVFEIQNQFFSKLLISHE